MSYLDDIAEEIRRAVPEAAMPEEDTADLFRLYAVLLLGKGTAVTGADVHNAWVAWMLSKSEGHESLIPFSDLDPEAQAEDSPFALAIQRVAWLRHRRSSDRP